MAAKNAFWKVEKCHLTKLANKYSVGLPPAATLFSIVLALIKNFLPACNDQECLQYTRHRIALGMRQDNWSDEVMACDEATAVLETSDAEALKNQKKEASETKKDLREFKKEFRQTATRNYQARTATQKQHKAEQRKQKALNSQYSKHIPDLSPSHVTVAEARAMVPPGASVWQDGRYGSWQGHLPPYPRVGRSWRKHGEAHALQLVLRHLWKLYLVEQGWGPEQCPVKGVFGQGEVFDETDDEAGS